LEALLPNVRVTLPLAAQSELTAWVDHAIAASPVPPPFSPDPIPCDRAQLPLTAAAMAAVEEQHLVHGPGLALLQPIAGLASSIQKVPRNCVGVLPPAAT
jgi:hypothetical protein